MITNKIFNFDDANRKRNGIVSLLSGLEVARAEAIINGWTHAKIDEGITFYKKRLRQELYDLEYAAREKWKANYNFPEILSLKLLT